MISLTEHRRYEIVTAPTVQILTVDQAIEQSRIGSNEEAALIQGYIDAAIDLLETDTHLILTPRTLRCRLDDFPQGCQPLVLTRAPLAEGDVTITYKDWEGEEQTLDADLYQVDRYGRPPSIVPTRGSSWPSTIRYPGNVAVTFPGGYAEGTAPPVAVQAVRLLVAHWFINRESVAIGSITKEIEFAYTALTERLQWM